MNIAFYTGASGMRAFQSAMDVTAHNIANVNTTGYQLRRASFDDLLKSRINTNVEGNHLVGHGVKQEKIDQLFSQSGLDQTMFALDFAIVGEGFFAVDNRGEIEYTRNGAFSLSIEGDNAYLTTNDGAYVLDAQGQKIALSRNADGSYNTDDIRQRLGVFGFSNPYGLIPQSNSRFIISENSGEAQLMQLGADGKPLEVIQGALEFSGVDLGNEMVNIITYQRAYQMNARVVQTADQMADLVNNLR